MADEQNPYAEAHAQPAGAGDSRPTALQVIDDLRLRNQLAGSVMLVTGSSSGIGAETARALYAAGARVLMQVRNLEKGEGVLREIQSSLPESVGSLELVHMSLDSLYSVRAGAAAVHRLTDRLHVLINNAGVRNTPEGQTVDGFETQFATNHLGHFLLFQLLKDLLLAGSSPQRASRVVNVTSGGHWRAPVALDNPNLRNGAYEPRRGYAASKTANVWMANHIERMYESQRLHALSVHPGAIFTGLQKGVDEEAIQKRLAGDPDLRQALKSQGQGAATQVWAAVAPVWEGKGGLYLEDMRVGHLVEQPSVLWGGYVSFLFDEERETELWRISNEMVGTSG